MNEADPGKAFRSPERFTPLLAVALMLLVAAIHQVNVRANELAPDVGGGFGMFAFVDNAGWRTVIVNLEDAEGRSWSVDIAAHGLALDLSEREVQRIRAMPSVAALAATADLVRTSPWYLDESGEGIASSSGSGEPLEITDVSITVFGVSYDLEADVVRRKIIASWPETP